MPQPLATIIVTTCFVFCTMHHQNESLDDSDLSMSLYASKLCHNNYSRYIHDVII